MKLIKKQDKKPKSRTSALDRARRRLEERKEEIALQAMPKGEYFMEQAECARTGLGYMIVWFREEGYPMFRVHEIVKDEGGQGEQAGKAGEALEQRQHAGSEFDRSDNICPWCSTSGGLIYCHCGITACKGSVYTQNSQRRCEIRSCGCDFALAGLTKKITGHAQPANLAGDGRKRARLERDKRTQIGRDKRAGVGHDKKALLGWKKDM